MKKVIAETRSGVCKVPSLESTPLEKVSWLRDNECETSFEENTDAERRHGLKLFKSALLVTNNRKIIEAEFKTHYGFDTISEETEVCYGFDERTTVNDIKKRHGFVKRNAMGPIELMFQDTSGNIQYLKLKPQNKDEILQKMKQEECSETAIKDVRSILAHQAFFKPVIKIEKPTFENGILKSGDVRKLFKSKKPGTFLYHYDTSGKTIELSFLTDKGLIKTISFEHIKNYVRMGGPMLSEGDKLPIRFRQGAKIRISFPLTKDLYLEQKRKKYGKPLGSVEEQLAKLKQNLQIKECIIDNLERKIEKKRNKSTSAILLNVSKSDQSG